MLGMGALGAAWGALFAICLSYVLRLILLRRYMGYEPRIRTYASPLIGCLVGAIAWLLTRFQISLSQTIYLLPIALAVYFGLLFITRAMTRADVHFIVNILKPSSTRRYLVDEFKDKTIGSVDA